MKKLKEIALPNSNLYLYGWGTDTNGNNVIKVGFPNRKGFSIQTNGVLPFSNSTKNTSLSDLTETDIEKIEKEVVAYVTVFGSKSQKSVIKKYAIGGGVESGFKIVTGHDHFKGVPLYHVVNNENDYVGEYHKDINDAKKELKEVSAKIKAKSTDGIKGYEDLYGEDVKKAYYKKKKQTEEKQPKMFRTMFEDEQYEYKTGGHVGKGEMVWKKLNSSDKIDFLYKNFTPEITPRSQEILAGKTYKFLPKNVKIKIESEYANVEEYKTGGNIEDAPRVYIADLAAYNEGKLVGEWIDLSDYNDGSEVMEKIDELLKKFSKKAGETREEYAVHDYENFSANLYSEYMSEESFDKVIKSYNVSKTTGIPADVIATIVREYSPDDIEEWINEHYEGEFNSDTDLAYHYVEQLGGVDGLGKDTAERYFDYESFGRDLAINDYNSYKGYYFRSYAKGGDIKKHDLTKYVFKNMSCYSIGGL